MLKAWKIALAAITVVLCSASLAIAADPTGVWTLVNPSGEMERYPVAPAARLDSLAGKTIVLRWNGKHNGDVFLEYLATLLAKEVPTANIVKTWEVDNNVGKAAGSQAGSMLHRDIVLGMKPDIVIASQGD